MIETIVINVIGVILILFVLLWFFGMKPKAKSINANETINVLVKDGVYEPAYIKVPAGKNLHLKFIREDTTPCSEVLVFPALKLSYQLPIRQPIDVEIPPQSEGVIEFTCQMGMYKGKLIVE